MVVHLLLVLVVVVVVVTATVAVVDIGNVGRGVVISAFGTPGVGANGNTGVGTPGVVTTGTVILTVGTPVFGIFDVGPVLFVVQVLVSPAIESLELVSSFISFTEKEILARVPLILVYNICSFSVSTSTLLLLLLAPLALVVLPLVPLLLVHLALFILQLVLLPPVHLTVP